MMKTLGWIGKRPSYMALGSSLPSSPNWCEMTSILTQGTFRCANKWTKGANGFN